MWKREGRVDTLGVKMLKANCMRCNQEFNVPAGIEQSLMTAAKNCKECTSYYSEAFSRTLKVVA
jgi:transcription elongation factor Elf1